MTPKQEAFVREYLIDLNATAAYLRAYPNAKPNSARVQACRMLADPNIADAIATAQQQRAERTRIDADWVLLTLAQEKAADLADLYAEDGQLKPVTEWPMAFRTGLVVGVESLEEYEGSGTDRRLIGFTRKVKLTDRTKHLELIGKHVGVQAWRDNVSLSHHEGKALFPTTIRLVGPDDDSKA